MTSQSKSVHNTVDCFAAEVSTPHIDKYIALPNSVSKKCEPKEHDTDQHEPP